MSQMTSILSVPTLLSSAINLCKQEYGACNYLEISRPLYVCYKEVTLATRLFGDEEDLREKVEFIITDDVGYSWKATREKGGQGIEMTLTR